MFTHSSNKTFLSPLSVFFNATHLNIRILMITWNHISLEIQNGNVHVMEY